MVSQNPPENKIKANCLHFEPSINIVMKDLHPSTLKEIELIKQSLIKQIGFKNNIFLQRPAVDLYLLPLK